MTLIAPVKVKELPHIPDAITRPDDARHQLRLFALQNEYSDATYRRARRLLEAVVAAQGQVVTIWRYDDVAGSAAHELFEVIVADPAMHELAVIATDAWPGTCFYTGELRDACGSWACTN